MKLMIIKFWVTLTFYNSILIGSCIGGALPYIQQNPQQNQILNRNPANSYGLPPPQSIIRPIQSQPLLNVVTQRPPPLPPQSSLHSQLIQQNVQQQQHHHQQQQQQQHSNQLQQQSIRQQQQPLLIPQSLPSIPNIRQQISQQHFQNRQISQQSFTDVQHPQHQQHQQQQQHHLLPQIPFQRSQDITSSVPKETTIIYPQKLSTQPENIFNSLQQQSVQSPTQQPYHVPISATLPPLTQSPLPPLQAGPVNNRIFTTSSTTGDDDKKIASNHIIVENYSTQDSDSFLTGAKNSTLYAAQLLAKSLLEASHENDSNNQQQEEQLNKTDLVVVKTQKKAYIIPMNLQGHRLNQTQAQELYQNRDKLPIAYTVNQFLFIIKPENVNFLNKLV